MRIEIAGLSDRGTERERNDDHYCIGPFVEQSTLTMLAIDTASETFKRYGLLVAVADGMGGYAGGGQASRVALETLSALFYGEEHEGCDGNTLQESMERYLRQTNDMLSRVLERTPEYADAGTTIAGLAMMSPDVLVVFHAGDSRVLRAAAGYVRALTIDHTPLGPDIASGRISEEEAAHHPAASQLTRALGRTGDTRVDVQEPMTWAAQTQYLMGSDGWYGTGRGLTRKVIQDTMRHGGDTQSLVKDLVSNAVQTDGRDNATLILVSIIDEGMTNG